jgi:hypothetical protein
MRSLLREDDTNWPKKNIVGKQELEIRFGNDHISFEARVFQPHNSLKLFCLSIGLRLPDSQNQFLGQYSR